MKKRIGTLTFQNTLNYGAILQSYALYRILSDEGYDAEVIDYRCPAVELSEGCTPSVSSPKSWIKYLMKSAKRASFNGFRKHVAYSPRCGASSIKEVARQYDCVIVGSDQVWNPYITRGDQNYFLAFEKDPARCKSYAASIGLESFPQEEPYASLIAHFSSILVRERTALREIERIAPAAGGRAKVVLDPTLLLDRNAWSELGEMPRGIPSGDYVLLYAVSDLHRSGELAKSLAESQGCRVVQICQRREGRVEGAVHLRSASPEEFLALFEGATATVVSSFHGICFSLLFEKPFWAIVAGRGASRMTDLLSLLGIPERMLEEGQEPSPLERIDYERISPRLMELREESLSALRTSLNN